MSSCEIRIEPDRHDHVYKIGDRINCTVHVVVDKTVKCNGLIVRKSWYTHGRGNSSSGGTVTQSLFEGEWQPGEYKYPCSFEIDSGPLTYRGHYINVDWQIMARADIPWAIDPKASIDFVVERNNDKNYGNVPANAPDKLPHYDPGKYQSLMLLVPLGFAAVGSGFAITGWMDNDLFNVFFGSIFVFVALIAGYKIIQNSLAQRKLGKVDIKIKPSSLQPGEEAVVTLGFTPNSAIDVNNITASLVAKEKAVSGSGTNRTTHIHSLHNEEYPLSSPRQLSKGLPVHHRLRISIPQDAPHTFIASDNSIEWQLVLTIDIDNWPDWSNSNPIQVLI